MHLKHARSLIVAAAAAALSLVGATAGVAQIVPTPTTPTTASGAPTTAPTTAPPSATTTVVPTTIAETKIITVEPKTKIVDPFGPGPMTTTKPGEANATTTVPPASLSAGQVDLVLRDQVRSGASSTAALVEALRPLQNLGMTAQEALALGMGQFPVLGLANWTDDWLDPRAGPPPHQHQGNDVFAAFDAPVRAPVDGTVRFEDAGLGGKSAFVTAADGTYYYMAHLNGFNPAMANGARVKQGEVVGYNGDSGNAKGGAPHVHFEVHPRGGAAVNPKPFLDAWLNAALARVPELLASFQPKAADGSVSADGGLPQILVATGLTRRFSTPSQPVPRSERRPEDFSHAVLGPLTPTALARLIGPVQTDK